MASGLTFVTLPRHESVVNPSDDAELSRLYEASRTLWTAFVRCSE